MNVNGWRETKTYYVLRINQNDSENEMCWKLVDDK